MSKTEKTSEKLYYQDPYLTEFDALVTAVIPLEKGTFGIELDQTCFYVEGGGQPGDTGKLNKENVLDTISHQNKILHIVKHKISVGTRVNGKIDWDRRFSLMQSHTAQHILSEAFLKLYKAQSVSVHFSDNSLTIDLDIPQLTWDIVKNIEHETNRLVMENRPVEIHWIKNKADLGHFPLRKPPQKKSEQGYRIVVVKDYDYSACGGMHVKHAGEIGLIKILKWHPTQRGIRMEYVCGWRALADYQWKNHLIIEDAKFFETKDTDLHQIIMKTAEDLKIVRHQLDQTQKELTPYRASALINSGTKHQDGIIISHIFQDTDIKTLRALAAQILDTEPHSIVLFASTNSQKKVTLLFNRDDKFHPTDLKMNDLLREVATLIGGKGGGKPNFAQGGGTTEGLTEAMDLIKKKVKKKLDIVTNG